MVSHVERGRRDFTGDLARIGYGPDRFDLPTMSEPLHRQRASTRVAARRRAKELVRLGGEVFAELAAQSADPPEELVRLPEPPDFDTVEDYAIDTRYTLNHEEAGPIRNLTSVVERAGVCLVPMVGLDGIDGISAWVNDVPVIGLNPSVPGDRLRLSLGHELGHLLFHRRPSAVSEAEANRFASALLFPRAEFDAAMAGDTTMRDFVSLKKSWGTSVAAVVYRAHELGHVDDRRYRSLQIQMSKWRRIEPAPMQPRFGMQLAKLVEIGGGTDVVARDLGLNAAHLGELLNWSHLRVAARGGQQWRGA